MSRMAPTTANGMATIAGINALLIPRAASCDCDAPEAAMALNVLIMPNTVAARHTTAIAIQDSPTHTSHRLPGVLPLPASRGDSKGF